MRAAAELPTSRPRPSARAAGRVPKATARTGITRAWDRPAPPSDTGARLSARGQASRSEEHTSELQSLMSISYAVVCLQTNKKTRYINQLIGTIITFGYD